MPRDANRNRSQEACQIAQLGRLVVVARDQQSYNFDPQAPFVEPADGVEDRSQATAELPVGQLSERLEIDLIEVHDGRQVVEDLGSAVAVGHKASEQALTPGRREHRVRPLGSDQRLVVGGNEGSAAG